jgi:hypothetical protein
MNRERLEQFRARFGIKSAEGVFKQFQVRVVYAAKASLQPLEKHQWPIEREFAFRNGSELGIGETIMGEAYIQHGIIEELQGAKTYPQLIERTQQLLWTFEHFGLFEKKEYHSSREYVGHRFIEELGRAIELSPGVDLRLQIIDGRVDLVPAGIELMDEIVDRVAQWLFQYPDVQKEFRQALIILAEKKREQYRQAQDSLRFALEKLLKILLSNNSRLEDQGKTLKEWLAQQGITKGVRDVAVEIMMLLVKKYQNATIKHDSLTDGGNAKNWTDHEVEYLLYQHTTLLRLLLEASQHGSIA